jgi:hypothetical protein
VLCPDCGNSVERAAPGQAERDVLDAHARSGRCDPARKRKPKCPALRCKETLTFSNTTQCKGCGVKVCLKHRFPADHRCAGAAAGARRVAGGQCGRGARKKEAGRRPLAVSIPSFKTCSGFMKKLWRVRLSPAMICICIFKQTFLRWPGEGFDAAKT